MKNRNHIKFSVLSSFLPIDEDGCQVIKNILHSRCMFIYSESSVWNQEASNKLKEIFSHWISNEFIFTSKSEYGSQIENLLKSAIEYQKIANYNSIEMINSKLTSDSNSLNQFKESIKNAVSINNQTYEQLKHDTCSLIYVCGLINLKHVSNFWSNVRINFFDKTYVKVCNSIKFLFTAYFA